MQHEVGLYAGRIFGDSLCVALTETGDAAVFIFFFSGFILPTIDVGMCVEKN